MVVRIAGVNLPQEKRIEAALTYIFGIGQSLATKILTQTRVNPDTRVSNLTEEEINRLREVIEKNYRVEGDLRREVSSNIKRLIDIGSYRGERHKKNLPVRGQRTKTNARTKRGRRVTMATARRKAAEKT